MSRVWREGSVTSTGTEPVSIREAGEMVALFQTFQPSRVKLPWAVARLAERASKQRIGNAFRIGDS